VPGELILQVFPNNSNWYQALGCNWPSVELEMIVSPVLDNRRDTGNFKEFSKIILPNDSHLCFLSWSVVGDNKRDTLLKRSTRVVLLLIKIL
jgi:hypothetical protein